MELSGPVLPMSSQKPWAPPEIQIYTGYCGDTDGSIPAVPECGQIMVWRAAANIKANL